MNRVDQFRLDLVSDRYQEDFGLSPLNTTLVPEHALYIPLRLSAIHRRSKIGIVQCEYNLFLGLDFERLGGGQTN